MPKKRSSRVKPLVLIILFLFLATFAAIYAVGLYNRGKEPIVEETDSNNNNQFSSVDALVRETFSLSKEGKVARISFISGRTDWNEVNKEWGKSNHISEATKGRYEEYENHRAVIGYAGNIVNDIRSYDYELQTISLNKIKKAGGEPDEVRFYKDATHDQIILVYHITNAIELSWILPKSTEREPNPKVDHISVYTKVKNKLDQQQKAKSISEIISGMTLDEKIGQMILAGISGTTVDANTQNLITQYKVGGIIFYKNNLVNSEQAIQLVNQIKSVNAPNLPLLLSVDEEGGRITRLPSGLVNLPPNQQIGVVNSRQFSYKVGAILGEELKSFGLNMDFAPVLDINSNPNNPVIGDRSFGDNAKLVSKLGIQTMKGIQSENIIATIKHFPGHGDTSVDSHLELPIVNKSLKELKEFELIPFKHAIDDGADVVMVAHILLPQLDPKNPASMSKTVITDVLRNQLGFKGVIITDDMTMRAVTDHFDIGRAVVESIKSGSDIILVGHHYNNVVETISSLRSAVQKGEIPEQRINESVARIIALKRKYEINNSKVGSANIEGINQSITTLLNEYVK
ncbi:beta-N-acetylhexosaminidase [Schinkia azotoformans]|uniref:beta-N-acetylhexosaminidase n=1 Tax=Schinkia azotoformans LMG 9581 TaxID=1131731 RepID=K6DKJ2_SCHAZ|nr:beta-N-acetylhexosaminidase [Schinkia azotoformans]EKN68658.1 lipoprotein ybbD [Schinkia azotoformans LMG 9581]MEC1640728.1 beta-N-acetylhexosaminidase [Schinkia azotoformans]MEC1945694.1 beta-N-acetylhexosaminidase [Schinkia azotoformans]